jgi:hypothetical protein
MSVAPAIAANRPAGGGSALRPLLCLLAALDTALGAFAVAAPHAFYRQVRGPRMRLPNSAHTSRPWRIHELTRDFRLEDVWALPTPGGTDDFPRLVQLIASFDPSRSSSGYGAADAPRAVAGGSARRPIRPAHAYGAVDDLRRPLVLDEVQGREGEHGVMHLGWVPGEAGGYRGQMAVLVKPNGRLGSGYMAAIKPFRHLVVYPPMMRELGRRWRARAADPTTAHAPEP